MKLSTSCLLFVSLFFTATARAQVYMFRGSPEHTAAVTLAAKGPLTDLFWKFQADGPVRASACVDDHSVFFGTASGRFYCLDKQNGCVLWSIRTEEAIHSSAAVDEKAVYFSNNRQTLFSLDKRTGRLNWQLAFTNMKDYEWGFDYFYSSPTLVGKQLLIGIKDGYLYNVDASAGNINWKFKTEGLVRSTAAVKDGVVYVGDTEGILYAIRLADATEIWRFRITGNGLKNEDFGFDRRAIISSPVVTGDQVIFGGRDGFLYAVDRNTGRERWRVDHRVSWVISSPAVKDSVAVTGTSDGHFVQAVNRTTGKEIWKAGTTGIVWSSPLIGNNLVYIGSNEGQLYCLDLFTGKRVSSFQTGGKIWSSPSLVDSLLFIATDKGEMYALKPATQLQPPAGVAKKMVFFEPDAGAFFKKSMEQKTREFLTGYGFQTIGTSKLLAWLGKTDSSAGSVIVFATNLFPPEITTGNAQSLLRKYLDGGGRVVLLGVNPVIYEHDPVTKNITGFHFNKADSVLGIRYPFNDLRSMKGLQPAFATAEGKRWGLPNFWTGFLPLPPHQVDVVLGFDENHLASAWVKRYEKGGTLVQLWMDQDNETDLNFVLQVAEHGFE